MLGTHRAPYASLTSELEEMGTGGEMEIGGGGERRETGGGTEGGGRGIDILLRAASPPPLQPQIQPLSPRQSASLANIPIERLKHRFEVKTYGSPHWCAHCSDFLYV
jgi:hypothetical protein